MLSVIDLIAAETLTADQQALIEACEHLFRLDGVRDPGAPGLRRRVLQVVLEAIGKHHKDDEEVLVSVWQLGSDGRTSEQIRFQMRVGSWRTPRWFQFTRTAAEGGRQAPGIELTTKLYCRDKSR